MLKLNPFERVIYLTDSEIEFAQKKWPEHWEQKDGALRFFGYRVFATAKSLAAGGDDG